jgi:hypothetical protein
MNKNKLIFSLFVAMNAAFSDNEKPQEKKEITKREGYYELENKKAFLDNNEKNNKRHKELEEKTKKEVNQSSEELKKKQEENAKKYNVKLSDINESSEELKKKLDESYANLTFTDKAYVACNNHWPKAAIFTAISIATALAYKYFSADQDDVNDTEDEE